MDIPGLHSMEAPRNDLALKQETQGAAIMDDHPDWQTNKNDYFNEESG